MKTAMRTTGFVIFLTLLCVPASADNVSSLLDRIHGFDISCEIVDKKFEKKICGMEHIAAYTALIKCEECTGTLAAVEAAAESAKKRKKVLEEMAAKAPEHVLNGEYEEIIAGVQNGNAEALSRLHEINDISLIPYLIDIRSRQGVIPSKALQEKLAALEKLMDERIATGGEGLDAEVLKLAAKRDSDYVDSLKRAVIALEGTRRKYPAWLPFVYAYGVGFIPFLFGIIASVKYYGRVGPQVIIIIFFTYLFYLCMHGFFQFVAPKL